MTCERRTRFWDGGTGCRRALWGRKFRGWCWSVTAAGVRRVWLPGLATALLAISNGALVADVSKRPGAWTEDGRACAVGARGVAGTWSEPETWAWNQICKGRVADFDTVLGVREDSGGVRSGEAPRDTRRRLGARFLRGILTQEPFRSVVPYEGIRIRGAHFDEGVDLRDVVLDRVLEVSDSRLVGTVMLNRLRTSTSVSFAGSRFEGDLWLDSAEIGGDLVMTNGVYRDIELKTVKIGSELALSDSRVTGKLNLNGATVGGDVFLTRGRFAAVNMTGATVGRQLRASGSTFDGKVEMGSISTGGALLMNDGAKFGEVILRGARIGGQLSVSGAEFGEALDGKSMIVGQSLIATDARIHGVADFALANVAGSVDFGGAALSALSLAGAKVGNDLAFGGNGPSVTWMRKEGCGSTCSPWMSLWNASVGGLVDSANSWPTDLRLMLRNFRYERLTAFSSSREWIAGERGIAWYIGWLERDPSYSFQPYQQLAGVFLANGEDDRAYDILVAGRERKRLALPWYSPERVWLSALLWTIRYGYGFGEFRVLWWALTFVVIGTVVAHLGGKTGPTGERPGFWYSVDMFLPGIQLGAGRGKIEMAGLAKHYFHVHRLVGYVLFLFVVAGVTGLAE